ncbi:MAG: hypothetical protein RJB10_671, partial [Pseudomonadota bacterium]
FSAGILGIGAQPGSVGTGGTVTSTTAQKSK